MKHIVAIADTNDLHQSAISKVLASSYMVQGYSDPAFAIAAMRITPPRLVIVGQQVGPRSGINFISDLRKERELKDVAIIFVMDREDVRILDSVRASKIENCLVKPYRTSALISAVAKAINSGVESSWLALPNAQRKALEGTLTVFNVITECLAKGDPIPFEDVAGQCSAVVEVVQNKEFSAIINGVKDHDDLTYVHSLRVATMLALFGVAIGLPKDQLTLVATGGFLMDVGKMTIPRELLYKGGDLSKEEERQIQAHVQSGQRISARSGKVPNGVLTMVGQHHERLDGSGYPVGLSGKELNLLARMAAIIDVFTAMTEHRPYRHAMTAESALDLMTGKMEAQFDQDLLRKFRDVLLEGSE